MGGKSIGEVVEDCTRVLALLEDCTQCADLDAGQSLLLGGALSRVDQLFHELVDAGADEFSDEEGILTC